MRRKTTAKPPSSKTLKKALTGIQGLDEITGGGLPSGRPTPRTPVNAASRQTIGFPRTWLPLTPVQQQKTTSTPGFLPLVIPILRLLQFFPANNSCKRNASRTPASGKGER
jgi:hypothetical protein